MLWRKGNDNGFPTAPTIPPKQPIFTDIIPRFLRIFLPTVVLWGLTGYGFLHYDQTRRSEQQKTAILASVELAVNDITQTFNHTVADLQYLADSTAIQQIAEGKDSARQFLATDLLAFSRRKGLYDQVRFLDTRGKERVRINYNAGKPSVVADAALQNKQGRYYFDDTLALGPDQIFVSPLDLNVERGQIEQPLKPMIRFGMPIYRNDRHKGGIVLLNFLAERLLTRFREITDSQSGHVYLLNHDGYWLSSPHHDETWGFMYPDRQASSFAHRYPSAWETISTNEEGEVKQEQGRFLFVTVHPIPLQLQSSTGAGTPSGASTQSFGAQDYFWKVVAYQPSVSLATFTLAPAFWAFYLLALLGITVSTWLYARFDVQERLIVLNLEHIRDNLEQQVHTRTRELVNSHEELAALLASTAEGLYGIDTDGLCTFANQACLDILGYRNEGDLLSENMHALIHHSHADGRAYDATACPIYRAFREGTGVYRDDEVLWRADGTAFFAEYRSFPIRRDNKVVGAVVTFNDITDRKAAESALRTSEEKYRLLVDNQTDLIVKMDAEGRFQFVSPSYCRLFDKTEQELLGQSFLPMVHEDDHQDTMHSMARLYDPPHTTYVEHRALTNVGVRWLGWTGTAVCDQHDQITAIIGVGRDIDERKQMDDRLRLAASVFTHAREGIVITDPRGDIIDVNDAFSRITGYSRNEVVGFNPRLLKSSRHDAAFYKTLWGSLLENGFWHGEIWNRRKSGEVYAEMLTISAVKGTQGNLRHFVGLFSDITALKQHEQRLEHIAHFDALTDLPNRVLLADRLHQAILQIQRRGQKLAVAYLDLDGFKEINDTHGHETGDQFLIALSRKVCGALRESDTIARIGGDEFVAILMDLSGTGDCVPMLDRLLNAASQPIHLDDLTLQVSASIGVTFYPQTEDLDADQLLRQSDQAMYQAKLAGKNRYHIFDAEQDRAVKGLHENLDRIRTALADGEFVLHYQPKVNMQSGECVGVEALIRWHHPERGLLPPAVFLPVVEDHPIAVELGEWVLDNALKQLEDWCREGIVLSVSINISARQLQQANFVDHLRQQLDKHDTISPAYLTLEILETSALEDMTKVSRVIRACHDLGVRFALDDFGTGFSSLTYLRRLPVDQIKIDRSFVRDMLDDPEDLGIIEGVLGLSLVFRREVVAEGVESVEHGEMLLQLGCQLAQGYEIARPMPATDLAGWLEQWRPARSWTLQRKAVHDDLPLLFAGVEHFAWTRSIKEYLTGDRAIAPDVDVQQCRFGQWLDGIGQIRHGNRSCFLAAKRLHDQMHDIANQLIALKDTAPERNAKEALDDLHSLQNQMTEQLDRLKAEES